MELPIDIDELLRGESPGVEWKRSVANAEGVVKTLTAFANNFSGTLTEGWVICGVEQRKDEHGFDRPHLLGLEGSRSKELRGRIPSLCRERVSPPLVPQVFERRLPEDPSRRLLLFYVSASPYAHAFLSSGRGEDQYWIRQDSETRQARGELLRELLRRKQVLPGFLEQPCPGATLNDLRRVAAEEFIQQARLPLPADEYLKPDVRIDALARPLVVAQPVAGGGVEPVPTHLAVLLFGREPTRFLPGAYVVFAVYDGIARTAGHSLRFDATGPLPKLANDVFEKLELQTGIAIDKSSVASQARPSRQRYSRRALREAVVNALAHRDYASPEPVRITVFDDRIEVTNPGGLLPGIDRDRLRRGRAPVRWRNPALASFLLRLALVENLGQGIPTIISETLAVAGREPEITPEETDFTVVIPALGSIASKQAGTLEPGRDGLLLISVGGGSIRSMVEGSLSHLGLEDAELLLDFSDPDFVEPSSQEWERVAREIRNRVRPSVETPGIERFHLFYRGPIAIPPLFGALIAGHRTLLVYHLHNGHYVLAYTLDRRFLIESD